MSAETGYTCTDASSRSVFARIGPRQNLLLATLPGRVFDRLLPNLEVAPLPLGAVLCDSDAPSHFAYFPTTGIISIQQVLGADATSEIAIAGRDGMFGVAIFTGAGHSTSRAVVHCAGMGYRLRAETLLEEFADPGPFRSLLLRYAQVRMAQVAQTAVCYRHHSVDQQVCRRLLMSLDRLISSEIPVTHELLAATLGVRREAITLATCRLQTDGLIQCSRGRLTVLDRRALQVRACECYAALNRESARLLPLEVARNRVA